MWLPSFSKFDDCEAILSRRPADSTASISMSWAINVRGNVVIAAEGSDGHGGGGTPQHSLFVNLFLLINGITETHLATHTLEQTQVLTHECGGVIAV